MDPALTGLLGAISAGALTGAGAWINARTAGKRIPAQNDRDAAEAQQARANAAKLIEEAAASAVRTVQVAAASANARLTDLQAELAAARGELAATRAELLEAMATLTDREATIQALRDEVARLRLRVRELETKVGGRRSTDVGPGLQ